MVQVANYDATSPSSLSSSSPPNPNPNPNPTLSSSTSSSSPRPSREIIASELRTLSTNLQAIHALSTSPTSSSLPSVPPELVQYVDNGRNPDIYTREFVELARRGNQLMRGKQLAFAGFRDVLAAQMDRAMPELRADVRRVVEVTGVGSAVGTGTGVVKR